MAYVRRRFATDPHHEPGLDDGGADGVTADNEKINLSDDDEWGQWTSAGKIDWWKSWSWSGWTDKEWEDWSSRDRGWSADEYAAFEQDPSRWHELGWINAGDDPVDGGSDDPAAWAASGWIDYTGTTDTSGQSSSSSSNSTVGLLVPKPPAVPPPGINLIGLTALPPTPPAPPVPAVPPPPLNVYNHVYNNGGGWLNKASNIVYLLINNKSVEARELAVHLYNNDVGMWKAVDRIQKQIDRTNPQA